MSIEHFVSANLLQAKPYSVAQLPAQALKLDAMELPCDFPPELRAAWQARVAEVALNRYPPAHSPELVEKLRARFGIASQLPVLFGNGSDEFIQIIQMAVLGSGAPIMSVAPSFVMYELVANYLQLPFVAVPLNPEDFSFDVSAMLEAIDAHNPAVIFLATPNNPTGNVIPEHALREVIEYARGLVVIDEAYEAYSSVNYAHLAAEYDNVVVMRTLSKTGFAGIRFGYLFGSRRWLEVFDVIRPPYNVNVLTLAAIEFVLDHYAQISPVAGMIVEERAKLAAALKEIGLMVYPSQANFLLCQHHQADALYQRLKEQGIWIKSFSGGHQALENTVRITVSNPAENAQLLAALTACLSA